MDIFNSETAAEFVAAKAPPQVTTRQRYEQGVASFIDFAQAQGWTTGATPVNAIVLWAASQGITSHDIVAMTKIKSVDEFLKWGREKGAPIREGIEKPKFSMGPEMKASMMDARAKARAKRQAAEIARAAREQKLKDEARELKEKVKQMELAQASAATAAATISAPATAPLPPPPPPLDQIRATAPVAEPAPEATIFPPAEQVGSLFTFKAAAPAGKGTSSAMAHLTSRGHKLRVWEQRSESSELVQIGDITVAAVDNSGTIGAALQQHFVVPYMARRYQHTDTAHFWVASVDPKTGAMSEKIPMPVNVPHPPERAYGAGIGIGIGAAGPLGPADPISQGFALLDALAARDAEGAKALEQRLRALTGRPDAQGNMEVQLAIRDCLSEIRDFRRDSRDALEKTRQDLSQALASSQSAGPSLGQILDAQSRTAAAEAPKPSGLDAFLQTEIGKNIVGGLADKVLADPEPPPNPLETLKMAKEILAPAHDPHVAALTGQIASLAQAMQQQTMAIVAELRASTKPAANAVDEFLSGMVKYDEAMKKLRGGAGNANWMDFLLGLGAIVGPRLDKVLELAVAAEGGVNLLGPGASAAGANTSGAGGAKRPAVPADVAAAVKQMLSSNNTDDILAGYATVMAHLRSTPEGTARTDKMVELAKQSNGKMLLIIGITDELQKMGFGELASIPRVRRVVETLDVAIKASMAAAATDEVPAAAGDRATAAPVAALPASNGAQTIQPVAAAAMGYAPQPLANIFTAAGMAPPSSPAAASVANSSTTAAGEERQWEPATSPLPPAVAPAPSTAGASVEEAKEEEDDGDQDADSEEDSGVVPEGGDDGPPSADDLIAALEEMDPAEVERFFKAVAARGATEAA